MLGLGGYKNTFPENKNLDISDIIRVNTNQFLPQMNKIKENSMKNLEEISIAVSKNDITK